MYIISITLKENQTDKIQANEMFEKHKAWFQKYFHLGNFLMMGHYLDAPHAGVIIAHTKDRNTLDIIMAEDVYYLPGLADYQIREFSPLLIAENISDNVSK